MHCLRRTKLHIDPQQTNPSREDGDQKILPAVQQDDASQGGEIRLRPYFFAFWMGDKITILHFGSDEICNIYAIGMEGKPCVIIDPGTNERNVLGRFIGKHHGKCEAVLLTHGHFDHIGGLSTLKDCGPVWMGDGDIACLADPRLNGSLSVSGAPLSLPQLSVHALFGGEKLEIGGFRFEVIATPFHTRGSLCFYLPSENALFSGDTLFHLGIGRTDLPGGESRLISSSLRKLLSLPAGTKVYPGHGETTTLGNEFAYNSAFLGLKR